eukprot:759889-Hanusia_phi.AAC.3
MLPSQTRLIGPTATPRNFRFALALLVQMLKAFMVFKGPKLSILSIKVLRQYTHPPAPRATTSTAAIPALAPAPAPLMLLRLQWTLFLLGEIHNAESLSEQVDEYLREQSGHNRSEVREGRRRWGRRGEGRGELMCEGGVDSKQEIGRSLNHHVRSPQNVQHTTKARERHRDITKLEQEENEEDEEGEEEDEMAFMIREIDKQGYNRSSVSWKKLDEAALRGRNEMFARGFVRAMKSRYDQQVGGEEEVSACAWCGKGFKSLRQRRIHDLKCKGRSAAKIVNPPQKSGSSKKLLPNVDETLFRKQKKMSEVGLC